MRFRLTGVLMVVVAVLLVSCASGSSTDSGGLSGSSEVSPVATPADVDLGVTESVVPTPDDESPQSLPDPASDRAVIVGRLILSDPLNFAPEDNGVYLVPIEQDPESEVSFSVPQISDASYQATVDVPTGAFTFEAIPVGFYALVVRTVEANQVSARNLATAESTLVMVGEKNLGGVLDLGEQRVP